jgi:UDP-glucose 4-epimerase
MNVVVTGGGFIGSHVVDALIAEGAVVHVVDDFSSGRLENLEGALERGTQLHVDDVANADAMSSLMHAVAPDVVLHLAAQIDVRRSMAAPAFDALALSAGAQTAPIHGVRELVHAHA